MNHNEKLFEAVSKNDYKSVRKLINPLFFQKMADVNARNNHSDTPLMPASSYGHKKIAELLIAKGADVNAKDYHCNTPLILASKNGHKEIVELLIPEGVDINAETSDGNTQLSLASDNGHKEIAELLIAKGANVNAKNKNDYTPLMFASFNGHKNIAELLIAKGANVNAKNKKGYTPLMLASATGHKDIAELLIAKGADSNAKTFDNHDAKSPQENETATLNALIRDLSLTPPELSLFHPQKEKAMDALKRSGRTALQPLLQALENSDEEAKGTIIYLLSCIEDNRTTILPISKQLKDNSSKVRTEAISALERMAHEDITDPDVVNYLTQAASDGNIQVREKAEELLAKIGTQTTKVPWYTGASTWKQISDAFIQLEIRKPSPDYKGLGQQLQKFRVEEQHGAWAYIAGKLDRFDKMKSMRCYIEALYNDPDPNSVAWLWLNGDCDKEMNILPRNSPKTQKIVEKLRHKYRPITEE
jgi:ankyrin repeat protein